MEQLDNNLGDDIFSNVIKKLYDEGQVDFVKQEATVYANLANEFQKIRKYCEIKEMNSINYIAKMESSRKFN
ncbi:MAG: hypothetical protein LBP63_06090 [Prevotellaceae bacterium]|jgi:hypothetical protein|nr:hypothetical protein [Prevotellaceae bacterium]